MYVYLDKICWTYRYLLFSFLFVGFIIYKQLNLMCKDANVSFVGMKLVGSIICMACQISLNFDCIQNRLFKNDDSMGSQYIWIHFFMWEKTYIECNINVLFHLIWTIICSLSFKIIYCLIMKIVLMLSLKYKHFFFIWYYHVCL